jgi:hypothetical protein
VSYGAALARLQQALGTGRLELTTLGYVDPSLSDLVANKLGSDAALQYDTGISACFTSIETTPSGGTAPAGGCIPPEVASALSTRGVTWAAADSDRTRLAGKPANSGVYRVAGSTISALVLDTPAGRGLESGDASATLGRTFDRMSFAGTPQPFATRIDLSQDTLTASETVLPALAAIEDAVWLRPVLGGEIRPGKGTRTITYAPVATPNAPAKFWPTVRNARLDAQGLLAVLGTGEPSATSAQRQSLLAESSSWSDPNATWLGAPRGLAFATSAIRTAKALFDQIKITAVSLTLAGAKGEVPITVTNGSNKTLSVVVRVRATNGVQISGGRRIDANLPPRDTFIPIPIDMKSALSSKVTVEVVAGRVVIAKKVVSVRRSYLDRLALIGGIVLVLGGLLIWIVRRVSTSPELVDIDATPMDDEQPAPSDAEHDPAADQPTQELPPVARDRDQDVERYTESDVRDDGEEPR